MQIDAEQVVWRLTQVPALPEHWLIYKYRQRDLCWVIHAVDHWPVRYSQPGPAYMELDRMIATGSILAGLVVHVPASRELDTNPEA